MRIGIDFDNTIVSYDALFHRVALEQGVVPPDIAANKLVVRDYLRSVDKEAIWTELQGHVYGARMAEAASYPGVIDFLRGARSAGHFLAIVSHKTQYPFLGPRYDLHSAARSWTRSCLCDEGIPLVPSDQIFFELTKEEKLARIGALGCDVFIDDLPEILMADSFPAVTRRILFDPEAHHRETRMEQAVICRSWAEISANIGS